MYVQITKRKWMEERNRGREISGGGGGVVGWYVGGFIWGTRAALLGLYYT